MEPHAGRPVVVRPSVLLVDDEACETDLDIELCESRFLVAQHQSRRAFCVPDEAGATTDLIPPIRAAFAGAV